MVMAVGISQYNVALMHVINHAFLERALFFKNLRKFHCMLEGPKTSSTKDLNFYLVIMV